MPPTMRILLVEDEHDLGQWLARALAQAGWRVDWQDDGRLAQASALSGDHDALVLDLGLPGQDGHQLLRRLRAAGSTLPVLVLTARDSLAERVGSLNEGADDFLAKPFALAELEARLLALVRRARGSEHRRLSIGPLQLDDPSRQFVLAGQPLALSPREHALLRVLIHKIGEPQGRQALLERVFDDEEDVQPSALDVLMHRLRRRLDGSGVTIQTYRGLGYALEEDSRSATPPAHG